MKRPSTAQSCARRIERVVAALHAAPDKPWGLDAMAAVACLSPFHFHRVYRAITGETPEETRRRLLLHRAAAQLIESSRDIAGIARRAGYGSVAAFTRAFSASYGQPPAAYRLRRRKPARFALQREEILAMPNVTIETEPARRLVGVPHQGSYHNIGQAFERLGALVFGRGIQPVGPMIGIYYDDPGSVPEKNLRSFAALPVGPEVEAGEGLEIRDIPGGPAASAVHKGPYAELPQAWQALYRDWLPASGREPADAPTYEVYLNDPRSVPPAELLTKIVVPLKG